MDATSTCRSGALLAVVAFLLLHSAPALAQGAGRTPPRGREATVLRSGAAPAPATASGAAPAAAETANDSVTFGAIWLVGAVVIAAFIAITVGWCVSLLMLVRLVRASKGRGAAGAFSALPSADASTAPRGEAHRAAPAAAPQAAPADAPTAPGDEGAAGPPENRSEEADAITLLESVLPPPDCDCLVDRHLWNAMKKHFTDFPRAEQGGFAVGFRRDGRSFLLALVLPEQTTSTEVRCEFSTEDIRIVREALDEVENLPGADRLSVITAWVHTHPNLGVFLSGTDRSTIENWLGLDQRARAVVVDAFKEELDCKVKAFNGKFDEVELQIADVPLAGALRDAFLDAVSKAYERHGRPEPTVMLAGGPSLAEAGLVRAIAGALDDAPAEVRSEVAVAAVGALRGSAA